MWLSGKSRWHIQAWKGSPSASQPGFPDTRALTRFLLCAGSACLLGTGIPTTSGQAFLRTEAPEKISGRTLTFAERVAYQHAIEEVYWRHRIWPKERPDPKPSLDAVMSRARLEKKVADYLGESRALEEQWQRPITPEQLQTEMERMASHTKQPEVLRELFAALGNDPFVIAECLARPIAGGAVQLAEREGGSAAPRTMAAEDHEFFDRGVWLAIARGDSNHLHIIAQRDNAAYKLPEISVPLDCTDDTWTATTTVNAPDARDGHTAVWTGSEMIIWGGVNFSSGIFEHRRQIQSRYRQLDRHEHYQRAQCTRLSHGGVDRHRDDCLGRRQSTATI